MVLFPNCGCLEMLSFVQGTSDELTGVLQYPLHIIALEDHSIALRWDAVGGSSIELKLIHS